LKPKPYQVFLSHASTDKWLATVICEKIELTGAVHFRDDRDIDAGDDVPETIRTQIKKSQELVVIVTPESVNRPWVLIEIGAAWAIRKTMRITAVLCHVQVTAIPDMLKSKKVISINELNPYLTALRERVKKHNGDIQ
jgi:hypothetical protein